MIAFLPLFLMALTWIRGLSILNAALLLRLLMWGSIGLLFYLLMPAVSLMSSDHGYSPWEIIKGVLAAQRNFLRGLPRGRFLLLAVVNILPLALVGIRWSGTKASSSLERILSEGAVILLQIGWLGMAVFMAFDRGFSQRELIHLDPVYSGIPLLTYYFAAALGAGYFMGYFLIVGGTQPSRNWDRPSSGVLALARLGWLAMCLIAVATPTALLVRNWPRIQVQNGTQLESLAQAMAGSLPQVPCLVLSDDPLLYGVLTAYLDRNREAFPHLLVNSSMAPEAWYRQRLLRIHGSRWQGMEAFASAQQGVAVSFLGMLRQAAVDHRAFYLNPAITFVTEAFEQRPGGAMFALKAYGKKAVDTTPLSEQEAAGIETFWKQHEAEIASIHAITAFGLPGPHELAVVWSRLANANGVELQESGRLEPASRLFATALQFNPDNAAAAVNQRVNAALRNHQPIPSDATKPLAGRIAPIVLSMDGPIDEPQFLLTIGKALQASTEPSIRSSLIRLARAHQLTPDSTPSGAAYAGACIDAGVPDRALAIVRKLKSNSRLKPDESSTLLRLEANALLASDDLPGAETVLMEARRTAPIDPGPLDLLSQLYNRTGRTEQALEMIDLWQGLRPNDVTVLLRRVMILSGQNRLDESLVLLDRVLKQEPENELARIERANCLFRLNRLDDSRKDYEQLVRRHPDRDSFQAALGAIAERKNETSTAITHYQRYLELAPADAAEYAQVKSRLERLKNGPRTP
jgi:tetratricopeptide (TPR) repeat protein